MSRVNGLCPSCNLDEWRERNASELTNGVNGTRPSCNLDEWSERNTSEL